MKQTLLERRLALLSQIFAPSTKIASLFSLSFTLPQLRSWVREEFGSLDVFDSFINRGDRSVRAIAPQRLLIIGAGNLTVSLWQSLLVGFVLGSTIWVKPAKGTEKELVAFLKKIPKSFSKKVQILKKVTPEIVPLVDAVIILGSDETVERIQKWIHPKQRFVGYGHRLSGVWIGKIPESPSHYRSLAHDILHYDQQGCLSPRWIWIDSKLSAKTFALALGEALNRSLIKNKKPNHRSPNLTPSEEAMIYELRQTDLALGNIVLPSHESLDWTIVIARHGWREITSLPRVIYIYPTSESRIEREFGSLSGDLSTLGVYPELSSKMESLMIRWGVSRICPLGKMQSPPVNWLHDGRPQLSDLVRWVEKE